MLDHLNSPIDVRNRSKEANDRQTNVSFGMRTREGFEISKPNDRQYATTSRFTKKIESEVDFDTKKTGPTLLVEMNSGCLKTTTFYSESKSKITKEQDIEEDKESEEDQEETHGIMTHQFTLDDITYEWIDGAYYKKVAEM